MAPELFEVSRALVSDPNPNIGLRRVNLGVNNLSRGYCRVLTGS